MQAGWQGKDYVSTITCARWNYKKFKAFLSNDLKEVSFKTHGVPVQLLLPYGVDRIGALKDMAPEPVIDPEMWFDIDREVGEIVSGIRSKTGALLYGPPGNGKTSLVKYLATKYRLQIMIFSLNPEWSNHDLLLLFSNIPSQCIVLMEDFDNYFDKRKCLMGSGSEKSLVKFTYDVILNGLDGVYNSYKQVVFIMTVNDIEKVDEALKNRPSRFKFSRCFENPSLNLRQKLLPADWALNADGLNLDQVFRLKEYFSLGQSFSEAMAKLDVKQESDKQIKKLAVDDYTYQDLATPLK